MKKVLLIEDDRWLASLEEGILSDAGYLVVVAHSALDAIDSIDADLPDVIIADVLLAGSTVFTLLHELQSYSDTGVIPVIVWTSIAEQFTVDSLTEYGVKRIIDKTTMAGDELLVALRALGQGI